MRLGILQPCVAALQGLQHSLLSQMVDALRSIGLGADETATLWQLHEAARAEEEKENGAATAGVFVSMQPTQAGGNGGAGGPGPEGNNMGGAGTFALGVLSQLLTTLHLLYEVGVSVGAMH